MLIGVVAIPYLLTTLGVERLGVLTLVWALIGYFSIFDFGLGRALTYKVAASSARGHTDHAIGSVKSGLLLLVCIGIVGAMAITAVVYAFGVHWLNVSPRIYQETYGAILIASAAIPVTTITSGLKGILEGLQNFRVVNILKMLLGVSNFVVPVATVKIFGANLALVVSGLLVARFIVMLLYAAVIAKIFRPSQLSHIHSGESWRELASFGAWMSVSNILSPLMVVSDRFVISHFLGGAVVAYYAIPSDFMFRLLVLPAALTTTLFPVFAHRLLSDENGIQVLYYRALRSIALLMLPVTLIISACSYYGLRLWLGPIFADNSYIVVIVIAFGILFNSMAQISLAMIQASGDVKSTSLVHLTEVVIYLPLLILAVIRFGVVGAALIWQLRVVADFFVLHALAIRKLKA
jgi:O-antigen/teichoic acid export membrane protein